MTDDRTAVIKLLGLLWSAGLTATTYTRGDGGGRP